MDRKEIILASGNKGKFWNACMDMGNNYHVQQVSNLKLDEYGPDAASIAENKVREAYAKLQEPVIAVDGAFYIPALGGYPGTDCNTALKVFGVKRLANMNMGVPGSNLGTVNLYMPEQDDFFELARQNPRFCYFVDALSYLDDRFEDPLTFVSVHTGSVTHKPKGFRPQWAWSDLWTIFQPSPSKKTLAEMTMDEFKEYQEISPSCFKLFKEWHDWTDTYSDKKNISTEKGVLHYKRWLRSQDLKR